MPGILFFKSTEVWGGGEKLTISLMEIVSKSKNSKLKTILFSNSRRMIEEAGRKQLQAAYLDLGREVARRRDIPGFLAKKPIIVQRLTRLLKQYQHNYNTVILQSLNERLLITPLAQRLGYRVIWLEFQPWTPFLVEHIWFKKLITLAHSVDQIIVNSQFAKQELGHYGINHQKISVLYSFVDPDHFKSKKITKNRSQKSVFTTGTVGRLHEEKGIDVFLRALALLPKNCHGLIVGDGPAKAGLEALRKQLNLQSRVKLVGFQKDPSSYYDQFDLFCQPSRRDNAPLTVVEAMAHGVPVVASNVGGIPELVGDAGILFESENVDQLAKSIQTVLADKKRYQSLRSQSVTQAKKFSRDRMAKSFLKIIQP